MAQTSKPIGCDRIILLQKRVAVAMVWLPMGSDKDHPASDPYDSDVKMGPMSYGLTIDHRIQFHPPPQTMNATKGHPASDAPVLDHHNPF